MVSVSSLHFTPGGVKLMKQWSLHRRQQSGVLGWGPTLWEDMPARWHGCPLPASTTGAAPASVSGVAKPRQLTQPLGHSS